MKNKRLLSSLIVGGSILIISLLALIVIHIATVDKLDVNEQNQILAYGSSFIEDASGFKEITDTEFLDGVDRVYVANNAVGYIIVTSQEGYYGKLRILTCIDMSGAITGIKVLELGNPAASQEAKLASDAYLKQYIGLTQTSYQESQNIEIIPGAETSSQAFYDAVNIALQEYVDIRGKF